MFDAIRRPRVGIFVLGAAKRVLVGVVEGALVEFTRNAAYGEQDQSKHAADGGIGAVIRTEHVCRRRSSRSGRLRGR